MLDLFRIHIKSISVLVLIAAILLIGCTASKTGKSIPKNNFHLYLLLGQSNMAGRGEVQDQDRQPHPQVLTMNKDNKWVPAADPIHFDKPIAGVGPGLTFGKTMAMKKPGFSIGLIPCAAGGSSIAHWKRGMWFKQTDSKPYDEAVRRTKTAMKDGVLKGIIWHQGEGDSNEESAPLYKANIAALIRTIRKDLGTPDVPFVVGELGVFFTLENNYAVNVNEALTTLPQYVDHTACVSSHGLEPKEDGDHFDTSSARELGRRYAEAMLKLEK